MIRDRPKDMIELLATFREPSKEAHNYYKNEYKPSNSDSEYMKISKYIQKQVSLERRNRKSTIIVWNLVTPLSVMGRTSRLKIITSLH